MDQTQVDDELLRRLQNVFGQLIGEMTPDAKARVLSIADDAGFLREIIVSVPREVAEAIWQRVFSEPVVDLKSNNLG